MEFYTVIGKDMEVLGQAMEYKPSQIDHIRMEAPYSVPTQNNENVHEMAI